MTLDLLIYYHKYYVSLYHTIKPRVHFKLLL